VNSSHPQVSLYRRGIVANRLQVGLAFKKIAELTEADPEKARDAWLNLRFTRRSAELPSHAQHDGFLDSDSPFPDIQITVYSLERPDTYLVKIRRPLDGQELEKRVAFALHLPRALNSVEVVLPLATEGDLFRCDMAPFVEVLRRANLQPNAEWPSDMTGVAAAQEAAKGLRPPPNQWAYTFPDAAKQRAEGERWADEVQAWLPYWEFRTDDLAVKMELHGCQQARASLEDGKVILLYQVDGSVMTGRLAATEGDNPQLPSLKVRISRYNKYDYCPRVIDNLQMQTNVLLLADNLAALVRA
jgi:hypothetical protein